MADAEKIGGRAQASSESELFLDCFSEMVQSC